MLKKLAVFLLALAFFAVAGCGQQGPVAKVNGTEISREKYETELQYELDYYEDQGYKPKKEELETVKLYVVDRLINNFLLKAALDRAGITPETVAEDVQAEMEILKGFFEDEEDFFAALAEYDFTLEEYEAIVAEGLMFEHFFAVELDLANVKVSPEEVEAKVDEFMAANDDDSVDIADVRKYFENTLLEEKIVQLKADYINELREQSDIEYFKL